MDFLFLIQGDKSFDECAKWCNEVDNCKGFAAVDKKVIPGASKCYLKDKLVYPGKPTKGVKIFYKFQTGKLATFMFDEK